MQQSMDDGLVMSDLQVWWIVGFAGDGWLWQSGHMQVAVPEGVNEKLTAAKCWARHVDADHVCQSGSVCVSVCLCMCLSACLLVCCPRAFR